MAQPRAGVQAARPRGRVLVVEDDALTRMLLEDVLALEGYQVRTAPDGAAGLAILREWHPDAIVLDVNMPDVDAPVFRAVQFDSLEVADVPVLLLSAMRAADLAAIARDLGVAAWLTKPFDVDALKAAVARLAVRQVAAAPGRLCGTIGDLGAFSLRQSKHMTTDDGGVTITGREDAGTVITIMPILVVYAAAQKYFVQGIT